MHVCRDILSNSITSYQEETDFYPCIVCRALPPIGSHIEVKEGFENNQTVGGNCWTQCLRGPPDPQKTHVMDRLAVP